MLINGFSGAIIGFVTFIFIFMSPVRRPQHEAVYYTLGAPSGSPSGDSTNATAPAAAPAMVAYYSRSVDIALDSVMAW